MPLDEPGILGTEKDHSKSTIYCIHCYRDGHFTDEEMTLERMKKRVRDQLSATNATEGTIREAVAKLSHLSRWLGIPAIHHNSEWH